MIYFGLLFLLIGVLIKTNIIQPTTVNLWGNNFSSNASSNGLLILSAFIITIALLNHFIAPSKFSNYYNLIYFITIGITSILLIGVIINHYKNSISIIICVSILCLTILLFYNIIKQPKLEINNNEIKFHSIFSYNIKPSDIEYIMISDKNFNIGSKIKGADLANYYRGVFLINKSNKESILFINKSKKPYVFLLLKDKSQIIYNNTSEEKTLADYNKIKNSLKK